MTLLQVCSMVLSRDIFVSREVKSKIAMWMGSFSYRVCSNALRESKFFCTKLITSGGGGCLTARNFASFHELVLRKSCQYWCEEKILFRIVWYLIHDYKILIPRSKLKCILMMRNNLLVKEFFGGSVDCIF